LPESIYTYLLLENYTKTMMQTKLSDWRFFLNQNRSSYDYEPNCAGICMLLFLSLSVMSVSGHDLITAACVLSFSCN